MDVQNPQTTNGFATVPSRSADVFIGRGTIKPDPTGAQIRYLQFGIRHLNTKIRTLFFDPAPKIWSRWPHVNDVTLCIHLGESRRMAQRLSLLIYHWNNTSENVSYELFVFAFSYLVFSFGYLCKNLR